MVSFLTTCEDQQLFRSLALKAQLRLQGDQLTISSVAAAKAL